MNIPAPATTTKYNLTLTDVRELSDEALLDRAWDLLTNFGRASKAARREVQRRIRGLGCRFFLGFKYEDEETNGYSQWGLLLKGEEPPAYLDFVEVGVSLDACAHKIGDGNAPQGWRIYWNS